MKNELALLKKVNLLITGSIFFIIFLFFIKIIFISDNRISFYNISYRSKITSKRKELDIQEKINKLKNKPTWVTPLSKTSLFLSRNYFSKNNILIDPIEYNTQLFYPIDNSWILKYNLDYSNPNLPSEDLSGNGFTNLEKWLGNDPYKNPGNVSCDPYDPESRPLLWTKLRCYSNELNKKKYYFYFAGIDEYSSNLIFILYYEEAICSTYFKKKSILTSHPPLGGMIKGLPLQLVEFESKNTSVKGINYDTSTLIIINPQTKEKWNLIKKSRLHPNPTIIEILNNITLEYTLEFPPRKINLKLGDTFLLESRSLNGNPNCRAQETYKLIRIDPQEAIIERDGYQYAIPILNLKT